MQYRDYYLIRKTDDGWKIEQHRDFDTWGWLIVAIGVIGMILLVL